jgi:hypothetical protein
VKNLLLGNFENFTEEFRAEGIDGLFGGHAQSDWKVNGAAFELTLMIEAHAGERAHESAVCNEAIVGKNDRAAGFVVIFEEAREIILVLRQGIKAVANLLGVYVAHRVIERFIVGEIEAQFEETLFRAPVGLGEKSKIWDR